MPGVRIQHPTARDCRMTVVEKANPYRQPYTCTPPDLGGCGSVHLFKTHHINLDGTGAGIVSQTVYDRIKPILDAQGVATSGEVANPPTIGIGLGTGAGAWGSIPILQLNKEPT